eukprot:2222792-Rhodomonas_salina.1
MSALRTQPPRRSGMSLGTLSRGCTGSGPAVSRWSNSCSSPRLVSGDSGMPGPSVFGPLRRPMLLCCRRSM